MKYISHNRMDEMMNKGWRYEIAKFGESEEELYNRLSSKYDEVKIYGVSTRIRGLHELVALCKNKARKGDIWKVCTYNENGETIEWLTENELKEKAKNYVCIADGTHSKDYAENGKVIMQASKF